MRTLTAIVATLTALATVTPALALEPLAQEKYVNDRLVAARVADRVRKECPSLEGRVIYAFTQARALKRYAEQKGYTSAQIDAFLDSKPDRQRIYAQAEAYLAQGGAKVGDAESYCRVGRAEMAAGSVAGSLLVAK